MFGSSTQRTPRECDQVGRTTKTAAETMLLKVAHGGTPPTAGDESWDSWLDKLSSSARFLRWVAAPQLPELHAVMIHRGKEWPENIIFAYF